MDGWPGGFSETGNKAISASIEIEAVLRLSSNYFYGWVAGWPGGLSEIGNKAISASIEIEVELS